MEKQTLRQQFFFADMKKKFAAEIAAKNVVFLSDEEMFLQFFFFAPWKANSSLFQKSII